MSPPLCNLHLLRIVTLAYKDKIQTSTSTIPKMTSTNKPPGFYDLISIDNTDNNTSDKTKSSSSSSSPPREIVIEINKTNDLLIALLQTIQAGQSESRAAQREAKENADEVREANNELLEAIKVKNQYHNDEMRDESRRARQMRDESRRVGEPRDESRRVGENRCEEVIQKVMNSEEIEASNVFTIDEDTLDSDMGEDSNDEEDDEEVFGDWPEEEEDDEEFHDKTKCRKERNKLKKTVSKLSTKIKKVEEEMKNIKRAINSMTAKTHNIVNNVQKTSYAETTSTNTNQYPNLVSAKNLQHIYKTPAVVPIQRRVQPVEKSSEDRIEEEFLNAATHIGFKPITFDHIQKEKNKLDPVIKMMTEEEQMDIISKKLIEEFLVRELAIPKRDTDIIISQIESIHPPKTTEPNTWDILYVKFSSVNIVSKIWSYAPQLPKDTPENQIKTELRKYIPPTLYENYKAIEAAAYEQRKNNRMQTKVLIGKDRFILKIRSKDGQKEAWKMIPEFIVENLPKITMSPRPRVMTQPERRTPTYTKNTSLAPLTKTAPIVENPNLPQTNSQNTVTDMDCETNKETEDINNKRPLTPEEITTNKVARIRNPPTNTLGEKEKPTFTTFPMRPPTQRRSLSNTRKTTPTKSRTSSPLPTTPKKKKMTMEEAAKKKAEEAAKRKSTMTMRTPVKTNKQTNVNKLK